MSDAPAKSGGHDDHGKKKTFADWLGQAFVTVLLVALFLTIIGPFLDLCMSGLLGALNIVGNGAHNMTAALSGLQIEISRLMQKALQIGFNVVVFIGLGFLLKYVVKKIIELANGDGGGGKKDDHKKPAEHH